MFAQSGAEPNTQRTTSNPFAPGYFTGSMSAYPHPTDPSEEMYPSSEKIYRNRAPWNRSRFKSGWRRNEEVRQKFQRTEPPQGFKWEELWPGEMNYTLHVPHDPLEREYLRQYLEDRRRFYPRGPKKEINQTEEIELRKNRTQALIEVLKQQQEIGQLSPEAADLMRVLKVESQLPDYHHRLKTLPPRKPPERKSLNFTQTSAPHSSPLPTQLQPRPEPKNKIYFNGLDGLGNRIGELRSFFEQWGEVRGVFLQKDKSGLCRGYGFVYFAEDETVDKILETKDIEFKGKRLYIQRAGHGAHIKIGSVLCSLHGRIRSKEWCEPLRMPDDKRLVRYNLTDSKILYKCKDRWPCRVSSTPTSQNISHEERIAMKRRRFQKLYQSIHGDSPLLLDLVRAPTIYELCNADHIQLERQSLLKTLRFIYRNKFFEDSGEVDYNCRDIRSDVDHSRRRLIQSLDLNHGKVFSYRDPKNALAMAVRS
ncbi:hypothetical protein AAMO2058_000207900 [Amorphochlora amoebiformis]